MSEASQQASSGTNRLQVAAIRERAAGEQRVALTPDAVPKLAKSGIDVLIESGAGAAAWFADEAYAEAGASILDADELYRRADVVVTVTSPAVEDLGRLRRGTTLIGMLRPLVSPDLVTALASAGIDAISMDGLARTISRAQSMDALSSQANVAGYKAVLVAADRFARYFPLLITAAGTAKPADVLVLGAGVAGLQAMGTARRLGAQVTGYDVRPETRVEIESVGARFLQLQSVTAASGEGGYARALTPEEQAAQQEELNRLIGRFDIVITTAQVPGRRPPLLVTGAAVKAMRTGSVIVDLAASTLGGNVEGSVPDEVVRTENGVTIVGAGNLPAQVPTAASSAFSNNLCALLATLVNDGVLAINLDDEIHASVVVVRQGKVVHPAMAARLEPSPQEKGGDQ